jgi:hypothetical protein
VSSKWWSLSQAADLLVIALIYWKRVLRVVSYFVPQKRPAMPKV